jgi:predicted pyridoxine 5'-phosphate oxidase superfamily flavin-nucleotide-binding protein
MVKMPKEVMDMFNDPAASKVLGTIDEAGALNAAPIGTLSALNEETIAFAEVFEGKTKRNIERTKKAAAVAWTSPPPAGYQIKGAFVGWQTSGPLFDTLDRKMKEMGMGIKRVGTINVEEVYSVGLPEPGKKLV